VKSKYIVFRVHLIKNLNVQNVEPKWVVLIITKYE